MSSNQALTRRFFEGFVWAVPTAFAGALAAHRFEQGDVLFRDVLAYDAPGEALEEQSPNVSLAIQVLHPPRSARVTPGEGDGDRRLRNWRSEVEIDLIDLALGSRDSRRISQGKLMMALWRGEEAWLDPEAVEPPMPKTGRELAAQLSEARAAFGEARSKTVDSGPGCRFVFVVDSASDASRMKARTVEEAMAGMGPVLKTDLSPGSAGVEAAETYHPTLLIRALEVSGGTVEGAQAALKKALYVGQAPKSVPDESAFADDAPPVSRAEETDVPVPKADRFSVARHGLLEALEG
jgi:hypothetical protein